MELTEFELIRISRKSDDFCDAREVETVNSPVQVLYGFQGGLCKEFVKWNCHFRPTSLSANVLSFQGLFNNEN